MPGTLSGLNYDDLVSLTDAQREEVMLAGLAPVRDELSGWEYRGFNTPDFTRLLGIQKFIKGFLVDAKGVLYGYNLDVENPRAGITAPWIAKGGGKAAHRYGFYDVVPTVPGRYGDYPNALLLDYGSGRNSVFSPPSRLRDFLVQVSPEAPDLYLGKAYLDLGVGRVYSNFFVLERLRRIDG